MPHIDLSGFSVQIDHSCNRTNKRITKLNVPTEYQKTLNGGLAMKRLKSAIALILMLLVTVSAFSGCGSNKPSSNGTTSSGKTKVVVWNQIFEDWNQKYFKDMCAEYNKKSTKYQIDQQFIAGDAWTEKMQSAQASGTAPDAYVMAYNGIVTAASKGLIMPLNDLIPQKAWDDLNDNVKPMISYKEKYYAYPQLLEPSAVLYYRTDLFQQAGIASAPKTWDELLQDAKKLTTKDVFGLEIQGFGDAWSFWGWEQQAAGHQAINDDWSKPDCTDQGFVDLANYFKSLYAAKVVPQQPLAGYTDILPYGKGEAAMQITGSWGIAELKNTYPDMVDKTNIAVVPTKDGNQNVPTATTGGWSYVIDAKSKQSQGAADYIYWLLGDDPSIPAQFFKVAKYSKAAPRKSINQLIQQDKDAGNDPWIKTIADIANNAIPEPIFLYDIQTAIAGAFEKVATGGVPADKALGDAANSIQKLIDSNSLAGTNPRVAK